MKIINVKGPNTKVYEYETENGLKVYIWPYHDSKEISLSLTVKYGSIHTNFSFENKEYTVPNGMAHFLEHIKFNEDENKTAHDYYHSKGCYVNAYTTYDHTSYEVVCNNNLKDNLTHLLYFVFNPFFSKSLIEKEKPIIVEESKMVLDDPYNVGYQKLLSNLYVNSNRKNLITGKENDINKITLKDAENVFNAYYRPDNMFLTVCGNIKKENVKKIVDSFMIKYNIQNRNKPLWINKNDENDVVKKEDSINVNVARPKVLMAYKIPLNIFNKYDKLTLRILLNLLMNMNYGSTSDFNEYLTNNKLKDDLNFYNSIEEDHVIINLEVSTTSPDKIIKLINKKFYDLEVDEDTFKRKIKSFIVTSIHGYDDVTDVNMQIRNDLIKFDRVVDNYPDVLKSLSIDDLISVKKLLNKAKCTSLILNPQIDK